jgi:hypothetical protein
LVEFALITPVLVLVLLGIFDFGRALFTYAQASSSLRRALRYGVVLGDTPSGPQYLDCETMYDMASNVFFANSQTVTVRYFLAESYPASLPADGNCDTNGEVADDEIENGDLLNIQVTTTVRLITPGVSSIAQDLTFTMEGHRTIVKELTFGAVGVGDEDLDGLGDAWELTYFPNTFEGSTGDPDGDGCDNECEETHGTDPTNPDTDGDGLNDNDEINTHSTHPTVPDTDGDGLSDGDEVNTHGTDPLDDDSDDDALTDGDEVNTHGTDPLDDDSDNDTLTDGDEVNTHGTDPLDDDSDGDTLIDGDEVNGPHIWGPTDPNDPNTDGDPYGYDDGTEVAHGTDPNDPGDPPAIDQVTGLDQAPIPLRECGSPIADNYMGLEWNSVAGVDGYYIYADGLLVGETVGAGTTQCGGSVAGCFSFAPPFPDPPDPGAWTPGYWYDYQVAGHIGGWHIGPLSSVFPHDCDFDDD